MSEAESKTKKLVLQIGSLNDEIKQTVLQVNQIHKDRDQSLAELSELMSRKGQLRSEIFKAKDDLASLNFKIKEESVEYETRKKSKEEELIRIISNLTDKIQNLETEIIKVQEKKSKETDLLKDYEQKRKTALELANAAKDEFKVVKSKLDNVVKDCQQSETKLNNLEQEFSKLSLSQIRLLEDISFNNSLLRETTNNVKGKINFVSELESKVYLLEEAYQNRLAELRKITQEYVNLTEKSKTDKEDMEIDRNELETEKLEFRGYKEKSKKEIDLGYVGLENVRKEYKTKFKDLEIIKTRLIRKWKELYKDVPFPKV